MLQSTFVHLPGVGLAAEHALWKHGIITWQDALRCSLPYVERCRLGDMAQGLRESVARLEARDSLYFHLRLPAPERWRLLSEFRQGAVCLDIETTGLDAGWGHITVIGLYDGRDYKAFVRGQNLHQFVSEVRRYSMVITYNGLRFDLPFIEAELGPVLRGMAHLDVMYPLRRLGYRGGLKGVEMQTGLARPSGLEGLSGYDAVLLWRLHRSGRRGAMDTLVRYNAEDVAILLPLAALVHNTLASALPVDVPLMPTPRRPILDLPYDPELVDQLKARHDS